MLAPVGDPGLAALRGDSLADYDNAPRIGSFFAVHPALAEAVRLTGDRQRADLLAAGAEEARARLQRQVGFALRDDPRRLRLAGMLEALGDRYV